MDKEVAASLKSVTMIDLSNDVQKALLIKHFSHNFETINLWLSEIILPAETQQFPNRLLSNAWHLCSNDYCRPLGFSGTDDNKLLLPLQVRS